MFREFIMLSNIYQPVDIFISVTFKLLISKHFISGLLIRRLRCFMFEIDISFGVRSRGFLHRYNPDV